MVRVIAFVAGIAAGVAVLLFVVGGISLGSAAVPMRARPMTLDVHEGNGSIVAHPTSPDDDSLAIGLDDDADDGGKIDLQGDEVTPAVATYKFDAQGNIYETHAPHTEVPKLGTPGS